MASMQARSPSVSMPSSTAADEHALPGPAFLSTALNGATWLYTTLAIIVALLVLEQSVYRFKKRHLPGDNWTIPIIGKFADSLKPSLEGYMKQWDSGALSAISVFNIFIVMASTNEFARKILNSPNHAEPCLVNSAKHILRHDNWVFLSGKTHVEYRRVLNTLFTKRALGLYITVQDAVSRKHFAQWLADTAKHSSPVSIMMRARDCNMDTSLRVFCGPYIPEHATQDIADKYWMITVALELVNFPLPLPGTKVYRAMQAAKVAIRWLEHAAAESKKAMASGAGPQCMLDEWVCTLRDPEYKGRREFSDHEMALTLLSFLFASQDAMSSGLIYGFQHLADHPEILAKVRDEQAHVRGGNYETPMTLEMMDDMPYLRAVVRESMRVKPPVTMVPYKTTKAFPISDDYVVPSGSMVIPSFYTSLHDPEVYPDPDAFIPERWLDPNGSANQNPRNYLVFGSGPHKCLGVEYAIMNMALILANAAVLMDWEHVRTEKSDKVQIIATLFPQDGCLMKFTPRKSA